MVSTDPGQVQLEKQEAAALDKVLLKSFSVTPTTVPVFGSVSIAWDIQVPQGDFIPETQLNGEPVPRTGSKQVSVVYPTTFSLTASINTVSRSLRSIPVSVNTSACKSTSLDRQSLVNLVKTQADSRFGSSDQFTLKDGGSQVTLGNGVLGIVVPLSLNIPDWFDADMTITVDLRVSGGSKLSVSTGDVSADVSWSFFENLASLECGHFVEQGMTKIAEALLTQIVNAEVVPQIIGEMEPLIENFINVCTTTDAEHRTFTLTSVGTFVRRADDHGMPATRI